jgi:acyl-CoA carboxylase subunit beta
VIPEEVPASKESLPAIREILDTAVAEFLETYGAMDGEALANQRYDRFRRI